jgi:hypothetical protein
VNFTLREVIWYVDPNAPLGGDGRSHAPLRDFAALNGPGGAGDRDNQDDYILVHAGTIAGGIELEVGQRLIGEGVGLSLPLGSFGTFELLAPGTQPRVHNPAGDAVRITSARAARVAGLSLSASINAIDLTTASALAGPPSLSIDNNTFTGSGAEGIDVNLNAGTVGTFALSITNNVWDVAGTHVGNAVDIVRAAGTLNVDFSGNSGILSTGASGVSFASNALGGINVTGFADNSVHGNTAGAGITMSQVVFDSNLVTAGPQLVNAGVLTIGASDNPVGGAGMTLSSVAGDLYFDDLDIFAGASALSATGSSADPGGRISLAVAPAAPDGSGTSVLRAGNGPALSLSSAVIDLRLDDVDSVTTGAGVSLVGVGGLFSSGSGASISRTSGSGAGFVVADSIPGASISWGGTMNVTSGAGIALTNNGGSTISFSGGMTLVTGTNAAFSATGGGTVTVTDPPGVANNTITTSSGTALNVSGTTIGAAGLTFERISAGTGGTPVNGIVLQSTGTLGGLTVTGAGSSGSGGIIQNASGDAISLTGTEKVALARMILTGNRGSGIRGSGVNGLVLDYLTLTNNGDSVLPDESGIELVQLTGTASGGARPTVFSNVTISGSHEFELQVTNTAGMLTDLRLNNCTISSNGSSGVHGNLVNFLGSGTANMTLNVVGGSFTGNAPATATGIHCDTAGGSMTCNIGGASFTNNNVAVGVSSAFGGALSFDIFNNQMTGTRAGVVNHFAAANSTAAVSGKIRNNTIGSASAAGSGSTLGSGIRIQNEGSTATASPVTVLVDGNVVQQISEFSGIQVNQGIVGQPFSRTTNVTITNNLLRDILKDRGVTVQQNNGTAPGTTCADVQSNTFTNAGNLGDGTEIRLRQLAGGTFNLRQTSLADLAAKNAIATTDVSITGTINYNGGVCPSP